MASVGPDKRHGFGDAVNVAPIQIDYFVDLSTSLNKKFDNGIKVARRISPYGLEQTLDLVCREMVTHDCGSGRLAIVDFP